MVKPGFTNAGADLGDRSDLRYAAAVAADLADGKAVAPEGAARAAQLLLGQLGQSAARDGLVTIYVARANPEEQAELLGQIASAGGEHARRMLERLVRDASDSAPLRLLTAAELAALLEALSRPPEERLLLIAGWLSPPSPKEKDDSVPAEPPRRRDRSRDKGAGGRPDDGKAQPKSKTKDGEQNEREVPARDPGVADAAPPLSAPARPHPEQYADRPRRTTLDDRRHQPRGDGDPPPDDNHPQGDNSPRGGNPLPDVLADRYHPEATRLNAALNLGRSAIPALLDLIKSQDGAQREFAVVALVHLGRTPAAAKAVYDAARHLEFDREYRPLGEFVRKGIEGGTSAGREDRGGRQQPQAPRFEGGWLSRALASCDAPSILQAAAGREAQVIPLVLRQIVAGRLAAKQATTPTK
jgi:hypothetical protein